MKWWLWHFSFLKVLNLFFKQDRQLSTKNYSIKSNERLLKFVTKAGNATHLGPVFVDVFQDLAVPTVKNFHVFVLVIILLFTARHNHPSESQLWAASTYFELLHICEGWQAKLYDQRLHKSHPVCGKSGTAEMPYQKGFVHGGWCPGKAEEWNDDTAAFRPTWPGDQLSRDRQKHHQQEKWTGLFGHIWSDGGLILKSYIRCEKLWLQFFKLIFIKQKVNYIDSRLATKGYKASKNDFHH